MKGDFIPKLLILLERYCKCHREQKCVTHRYKLQQFTDTILFASSLVRPTARLLLLPNCNYGAKLAHVEPLSTLIGSTLTKDAKADEFYR